MFLRTLTLATVAAFFAIPPAPAADALSLQLRFQTETQLDSGRYHRLQRSESWQPERTAVIVCDMWDSHHCYRAVQRGNELAPRLNALLNRLREQGVTVIHAPSGCVDFYADHPARQRVAEVPAADEYPDDISRWCYQIPAEESAEYPIDQSDGGEDDTPEEHRAWEAKLIAAGRDPDQPWQRQTPLIEIDGQQDFISDSGKEIWNILQHHKVDNVMLTGVHTNMCVLGRPFGLRRMATAGKNVVLVRDMTDTMYNPASRPFVSHFTGTDLIVSHIERHVCPTITSDQVLGGQPFRFQNDQRPHVGIVIGEREYDTKETLPAFALKHLGDDYRVSYYFASPDDRNAFPGIELLSEADMAIFSVRRRTPPVEQLQVIRQFEAAGKPMIGLRTASHAFALRGDEPPEGHADWPQFDAEVWGGNYTGHYGNELKSLVRRTNGGSDDDIPASEILEGVEPMPFQQAGSLYKTSPLAPGAIPLLEGKLTSESAAAASADPEPVAWIFRRANGGASFYTSLGHRGDFAGTALPRLLKNAVDWAARQQRDRASDKDAESSAK